MLKSLLLIVVFAALCNSLLGAAAYTWPNTQTDHLEGLLYEQVPKINGVDQPAMAFGIIGCSRGASDSGVPLEGRTNSAEWLRTAYHDMATADVVAGTGGIDVSIGFEFADRAENRGRAFFASLAFFNNHVSIRSSMADLIALGTTMAVGSCSNGTVLLPYRAGRIDALAPGPSGVPQPHEDLASHTASFARQGFNASEMAALVACGHTLGGVHGSDFPEIVPVVKDPTSSTNRQDFDSTFASFDNNIAMQFVSNITQNPLAFGLNETTNSDHRIFNVDGGDMISRMAASQAFFLDTCTSLLSRMIDTVPRNVTLTEPIQPVRVKPVELDIDVFVNGTMTIRGKIRIIEDGITTASRRVFLDFKPRSPDQCSPDDQAIPCVFNVEVLYPMWTARGAYPGLPHFTYYTFVTNIPVSWGVSSFDVRIEDQSQIFIEGNGGSGYPVDDRIFPQLSGSCQWLGGVPTDMVAFNVTIAARNADVNRVLLHAVEAIPQDGSPAHVPRLQYKKFELPGGQELSGTGYTLYQDKLLFRVPSNIIHIPTYDLEGVGDSGEIEKIYNIFGGRPRYCDNS